MVAFAAEMLWAIGVLGVVGLYDISGFLVRSPEVALPAPVSSRMAG
jgi:hypothetical protein